MSAVSLTATVRICARTQWDRASARADRAILSPPTAAAVTVRPLKLTVPFQYYWITVRRVECPYVNTSGTHVPRYYFLIWNPSPCGWSRWNQKVVQRAREFNKLSSVCQTVKPKIGYECASLINCRPLQFLFISFFRDFVSSIEAQNTEALCPCVWSRYTRSDHFPPSRLGLKTGFYGLGLWTQL